MTWTLVVLVVAAVCIALAPTFAWLWAKWMGNQTYSHGLVVPLLCAYLLFRERDRLNAQTLRPTWIALVPLVALLFAWSLSFAAGVQLGAEILLPLILLAAILFTSGPTVARLAGLPILLFYSAITIWDYLNPALQKMTVLANDVILGALGVPAFINGNFVEIPSGWFEIEGGCSGLHFFIVAVTLAAVYGHLYYTTTLRKLALILIGAVMAMITNWVRVSAVIVAGHLTEMQSYLVREDHYVFGWVLFVFALVPFFYVARRLEEAGASDDRDRSKVAAANRAVAVAPSFVALSVVLVLAVVAWGRIVLHTPVPVVITLPSIDGMAGPDRYTGTWAPRFPGAQGETMAIYSTEGAVVDIYVNWFDGEAQGRELIGYSADLTGRTLVPRYDRINAESEWDNVPKSPEFREIMAESATGELRLIQYFYIIGGDIEVRPLHAKLGQAMRSLTGEFGSGMVAWSMRCEAGDEDCSAARQILRSVGGLFRRELVDVVAGSHADETASVRPAEVKE